MKLKTLVLAALAFSFLFVGGVRAEEVEPVVVDTMEEEVSVPNPESFFFGLQVAWMRVTNNIEIWLAKTDEKKTDLEIKFAEREAVLLEKIIEVSESNPELAEKLEGNLDKLGDRYDKRLERIDAKIESFETRGEEMEQRMLEWQEKIQTRREMLEQKKNQIQERIENKEDGDQLQDGSGDGDGAGVGVGQMQG